MSRQPALTGGRIAAIVGATACVTFNAAYLFASGGTISAAGAFVMLLTFVVFTAGAIAFRPRRKT